jgi:hypothetical protein
MKMIYAAAVPTGGELKVVGLDVRAPRGRSSGASASSPRRTTSTRTSR